MLALYISTYNGNVETEHFFMLFRLKLYSNGLARIKHKKHLLRFRENMKAQQIGFSAPNAAKKCPEVY